MNAERHWHAALGQLQMELPRAAFDTWVRDAEYLSYEDSTFIIGVRNAYARDWLEDRLLATVKRVLTGILGTTVDVRFVVWQGEPQEESIETAHPAMALELPTQTTTSCLNNRYTFDTFVVGPGNRLAHAAAQAVAESPAKAYNPLFLYGGVGLGKTHLLHAVGHACVASGLNVLYVSSEEFTNDLVNAIRARNTAIFRDRYRRIDVLLIDDIQFIAGKESTQEEFFHTFNTLHGQDKQLVISSDRLPRSLVTLEERLRSRFEWGLTADIQAPDFETRLAILGSKTERAGRQVDDELLKLIAQRVQSNIRELEGALTRVLAYADLTGQPLTIGLVEMALGELAARSGSVTADDIIAAVAHRFHVDEDLLLSRDRSKEIAHARQVAMYLIREETSTSLPKIGVVLGGRDHSTIMYGCEKIGDQLETDEGLRRDVMAIREQLFQDAGVTVKS
ncbi:MAG: chromosomal replication initiator protein DnaA [Anaerolineales bacterium]|nr:MAG: chromosomal replication initiator protein DnaA [Anaerolineales bacterium]